MVNVVMAVSLWIHRSPSVELTPNIFFAEQALLSDTGIQTGESYQISFSNSFVVLSVVAVTPEMEAATPPSA
jgi:hypothetical protein